MSQDLPSIRTKLPHAVIVRAPGLLPMQYTVRELADELSMPERTLHDWLHHGAPHSRDRLGHIWVDGQAFMAWVASQRKKDTHATCGDITYRSSIQVGYKSTHGLAGSAWVGIRCLYLDCL